MLSEKEVGDIAGKVLRKAFGRRGFQRVHTAFEEDFDGVEIIRLRAHFRAPLEDSLALLKANDDIHAAIAERGDRRFVFLSQTSPQSLAETGGEEDEEDAPGAAMR